MSTIADFVVPLDEFVLSHTLRELPGIDVEVERVVSHLEDELTPYFRVVGERVDGIESMLADDPTVADVRCLEKVDDERFYRATWRENVETLASALRESEATIMHANTIDDGDGGKAWELRMLFADREDLSAFHDRCGDDLPLRLASVYDRSNPATYGEFEITPDQRDTLVAALDAGYFDVPRSVTVEDLADRFGISSQAVSQRLRRGHANLIRNTLVAHDRQRPDVSLDK